MTFKSKVLRKLMALGILYESEWAVLYLADPIDHMPWVIIDDDGALDYSANGDVYNQIYNWTEDQLIEVIKYRMQADSNN